MSVSEINTAKTVLHEIANHTYNLAMGLQNAAPAYGVQIPSIQYLKETAILLEKTSKEIDFLVSKKS